MRWLVLCLLPHIGLSQLVSFGVKVGAPISPESNHSPYIPYIPMACAQSSALCANNYFGPKPYAVGPSLEAFLPLKFSLEADVLYRRFHKDISEVVRVGAFAGGAPGGFRRAGLAANAWFFPLLLKYSPTTRKRSPFVAAGATLRHLGPFDGQGLYVDLFLKQYPLQAFHEDSPRNLDVAITAGVGVRLRVAFLDVLPEIRFMHWTSPRYQPVQNQAMLLLGITFPAPR